MRQHASLLFAFGGRNFTTFEWSEPGLVVPVGATLDADGRGDVTRRSRQTRRCSASSEPIAAAGIVESVSTGPSDGSTATQTFRCVAAGEAPVGVTYVVSNVNAESVLFSHLGLGPASTQVTVTQTITCTDEPVATPTPGPSDSPAASLPSL